jgi:ribonucleoside-diphosphate reductase alpha chain
MLVLKRDGHRESVKFDKITARIEKLCYGLDPKFVNPVEVAMKVINGLYDGVSTQELDNLAAEIAATMTTKHPDFARLAARIAVSNLHKVTSKSFSNTMKRLYTYVDPKTGENAPLISKETWRVIKEHAAELDEAIIYDRDFGYDYFGFKTLERSYLMKVDGKVLSALSICLCALPLEFMVMIFLQQSKRMLCSLKNGLPMQHLLCSMPVHLSHNSRPASFLR